MTATPKRRWFRFSLRAMLVVLTVFGVWLGVQVNRANNQRRVVNWLRENDVFVRYDFQFDSDGQYIRRFDPPGPAWLQKQIGDEYFQSVVQVVAFSVRHRSSPTISDLSPLAELPRLKMLDLRNTQVVNLSPVANLTMVESIDLSKTPVSDISPLAKLVNLTTLDLSHTQVVNLTPLARLLNLEDLRIEGTAVSDEEVSELQNALPRCNIKR